MEEGCDLFEGMSLVLSDGVTGDVSASVGLFESRHNQLRPETEGVDGPASQGTKGGDVVKLSEAGLMEVDEASEVDADDGKRRLVGGVTNSAHFELE